MKLISKAILMLLILAGAFQLTASSTQAGSGQWAVSNASVVWRVTRVCPTWAEIEVVNTDPQALNAPKPGQSASEYLTEYGLVGGFIRTQPYLYDIPFTLLAGDFNDSLYFYSAASAAQVITNNTPSNTPYPGDANAIGVGSYLYTRGIVTWRQHLPIGAAVIFGNDLVEVVEGGQACSIDPTALNVDAAGSPVPVEVTRIDSGYNYIPKDSLRYEINTVPASGVLKLGELALAEGSAFHRSELESATLTYYPEELALTDQFSYMARATFRVSVNSAGEQAAGLLEDSMDGPAISADGSNIAFSSNAINLYLDDAGNLNADQNAASDVFKHVLTPVGRNTQAISVNPDDTALGTGPSSNPDISPNGATVVFTSQAGNLLTHSANPSSCSTLADWNHFVHTVDTAAPQTTIDDVLIHGREEAMFHITAHS